MYYTITRHRWRSDWGAVMEVNDVREQRTAAVRHAGLSLPGRMELSSETKLKDLPSVSRLLCAPLPLCWVAFTTMRWKCDTVRWDSCLGLYRGLEVCVTYFQRLLAAPRTAAEDCYDSFPLRAQESIFSLRHFYSSSVTLIFPFSTVFCNAVIQAA